LTPMTDANLLRVLQSQTARKVGLVTFADVVGGGARVRAAFDALRAAGVSYAVTDVLRDEDLMTIGAACAGMPLVTAGSGVALGLAQNFVRDGLLAPRADAAHLPAVGGQSAVLAGSCSEATRNQVAVMARRHRAVAIDPLTSADPKQIAAAALAHAADDLASGKTVLIYSSAEPQDVARVQRSLGAERAAALVESVFAEIAPQLVARGVRRLVVAGGETSGAVVNALGIEALAIGPQIDPGVPWTMSLGAPRIALALKSGNFGAADFFEKALAAIA